MNRIFAVLSGLILGVFSATAFGGMSEGDKPALLMVHFGTTYDDTRLATIDAINEKAVKEFPDMKVMEAYTSRIVISRLAGRGVDKPTPRQALLRLAADGYTHVFVQSTNVIDGIEAEALRNEVAEMASFFKEIRVGRPLLYSIDDCRKVAAIMAEHYGEAVGKASAVVLVGHGTETPANAIYSQMDYIFDAEGHQGFHVATIEGYPTYETVLARLKHGKIRNVTVVPFMFVAGDHARNDIAEEWRSNLEKEGFKVSTVMIGLGQMAAVQDIYIDHIKQGLHNRPLTPSERKAEYIKENL